MEFIVDTPVLSRLRSSNGQTAARRMHTAGTAFVLVALLALLLCGTAKASFGVTPGSFQADELDPNGNVVTSPQAGAHPFAQRISMAFNTEADGPGFHDEIGGWYFPPGWNIPDGQVKDISTNLPAGLVGNPQAVPRCAVPDLRPVAFALSSCPTSSQVGTMTLDIGLYGPGSNFPFIMIPLYNLEPPKGTVARFGAAVFFPLIIDVSVRSNGDYGVTAKLRGVSQMADLFASSITLWGVPADSRHDAQRFLPQSADWFPFAPGDQYGNRLPSGLTPTPFLTNPSRCGVDLVTRLSVSSWQNPGDYLNYEAPPVQVTGCDKQQFNASLNTTLHSRRADSPSALSVDLHVDQADNPNGLGTPPLKTAVVTLPSGVSVSPSAADGLNGCTLDQVGLGSLAEPTCPDGSKIGTVEIDTPVLSEPLTGSFYQAKPNDNPFGSLMAIYVVAEGDGVIVKLPGHIELDPNSGQLRTTFDDNPQLPFSDLKLNFAGGPRAPIVTPTTCGVYTTHSLLTAWSGQEVDSDSTVTIDQNCGGGFQPALHAGSTNPVAGAFSPFVLSFSRQDGEAQFKDLSVSVPSGVLAKVKDVPLCPDAQAAAGTCDASSRVGSATVGSGAGPNPFYLQNQPVYLTGAYKEAPYGLAVVVRALAGPFDLGTVVVRQAVNVDPYDATITVASDPLPTILSGVPLRLRDVRVSIDRAGFMTTPTSCAAKSVTATFNSIDGSTSRTSVPYQVAGCGALSFAPKLAMGFTNRSQTHRKRKPGLDFTLSQRPGESNIKSVTVKLPRAVVLDVNGASGALCEVAEAERDACPASSVVGQASVVSPLLNRPLIGNVYFVRAVNALPNLMIALRGEISLNLRSTSRVDKQGRLISTFSDVPDAAISQFQLRLRSAGHGVLAVAPDSDLCTGHNSKGRASIAIVGQNGVSRVLALKIKTPCRLPRKHKRSVKSR